MLFKLSIVDSLDNFYSLVDSFSSQLFSSYVLDYMCDIYCSGFVPNSRGRVLSETSGDPTLLEEGLYVCGWLKRGPTGIIATNSYCAEETVSISCSYVHEIPRMAGV